MKVTLQNMFPSINVATIKLSDCRRVVMFNLDKATGSVEMRHYAVRATPTGITKAIKKVCLVRYRSLIDTACAKVGITTTLNLAFFSRDILQYIYLVGLAWCLLVKPLFFTACRVTCFPSIDHSDGALLDGLGFR